ncbi:MAG: hypothetical protein CVV53_03410 [Spirochaetae bacterium HGW-Spirochaetae-9]|nr:MAG: hypothetical protein CVV53_03410 [Spirochaetae bacterium HGW-Spirochaetae-9]
MKFSIRWLLPCLLTTTLIGCGLPTVAYLYPPKSMTVENATIRIQNDSQNFETSEGGTQTFKGIEVFYRIYQDNSTASTMLSTLGTLSESYDENPDRFIEVATGSSYKFMRLRNSVDRIQPLLSIAATDDATYYIQLNGLSNWTLTNGSTIHNVIRTISTTSDDRFYARDFKTGDDDYGGTTSGSGSTYYMVFFAVSYGQDQTTVGQNVYSMPFIPSSYVTY